MPRSWKVWAEPGGKNWRCRWSGAYGTGQQVFVAKDDAEEFAIAKKREFQRRDAGLPDLPKAAGQSAAEFEAFRDAYIRWLGSRRDPGTVRNVRRAFKLYEAFAGQVFPTRRGPGPTPGTFSDWLMSAERPMKKTNNGHRANGARVSLRHFKAACRWGYGEGMLPEDPFFGFEFPAAVSVARYLKKDEALAVLKALPDDCRRAAYFTLHTGLRISEVLRLDWANVERSRGKWYFTVLKSKTRRVRAPETKTQAIHPNARSVMGAPRSSGRVFDIKSRHLNKKMFEAAKELGLGRIRWHDLRHTWATNLMEDVRDLRALMDAGGWATVEAAMIYQHKTQRRTDATLGLRSKLPQGAARGG